MAQKNYVMHGRDHQENGADPIPNLAPNLATIKGIYQDAAISTDFIVGQTAQGDDANWFYVYQLPSKVLFIDGATQYISTVTTDDGSSPLWLVSLGARIEGLSGVATIYPAPSGVHAAADESDSRHDVNGIAYLQRTYLTGGPPPCRVHVITDSAFDYANVSLSVTQVHTGPVFEVGEG